MNKILKRISRFIPNAFNTIIHSIRNNQEICNLKRVENDLDKVIEKHLEKFVANGIDIVELNKIADPIDRFIFKLDSIKYISGEFTKNRGVGE